MASKDDRLWFRADEALTERIDKYEQRSSNEDRSKAIRDLIETGLEHKSSPVHSLRPFVLDAAVHLVLVAAAVIVAGAGTDLVADIYAIQIGGVLVAVAGAVLAIFELAHRLTNAHPEIADALRSENA